MTGKETHLISKCFYHYNYITQTWQLLGLSHVLKVCITCSLNGSIQLGYYKIGLALHSLCARTHYFSKAFGKERFDIKGHFFTPAFPEVKSKGSGNEDAGPYIPMPSL